MAHLLQCTVRSSPDHLPLFSTIIAGDSAKLQLLLEAGLELLPAITTEHRILHEQRCSIGTCGHSVRVLEPSAKTESLSLLMCAASIGNTAALQTLIDAGARDLPVNRSLYII